MIQNEIDEISDSFHEAWVEYFGTPMYLIPYSYSKSNNSIYGDKKKKEYDLDNATMFHGTLKQLESADTIKPDGRLIEEFYDITLVTKELVDQGVNSIDTNSLIKFIDRFRNEHYFKIYDTYQKVQFSNNKIFTKIRVKLHEQYNS